MSLSGCRSSGLLTTTDTTVFSGRCKLVSIHGYNEHATATSTVTIYDNIASSGKVVAKFLLPALKGQGSDASANPTFSATGMSLEFDMHGVICTKGLRFTFSGGTPSLTIEYA